MHQSTLRSRLHPSDATPPPPPSVFKPSVCESQFDLINISASMKLRMFLVYIEPSTMRIGEAGFEQLANVVSFRAPDFVPLTQFSLEKMFFSATGRCCSKTLLTFMAKNRDKYALFLPKLFAHKLSY